MRVTIEQLEALSEQILASYDVSPPQRRAITETLVTAQKDECHSHGVWRLIEVVKNIENDRLNPDAKPKITLDEGAVMRIDADMGAAPYAFSIALPHFVEKAKKEGIALLGVNHAIHFSALWVELEALTKEGLVALNMTTSHAWVAPFGGKKPLLGTNPFAFAWPRHNHPYPYLFDFATSAIARGEIQLHLRNGTELPKESAIDANGEATLDPQAALDGAMLTFGAYKGSALSTMIELLAGPLIGDLTSQDSLQFAGESKTLPYGGEIIIAIDPKKLLGGAFETHFERAEKFLNQFSDQGIRLPSERRFKAREETKKRGFVEIDEALYQELQSLIKPN